MKYITLLLFSVSACAEWNDWHSENKELYKRFVALNIIDVYQSDYLLNKYSFVVEANPLFGKKPSTEKLILAKAAGLYGAYLLLDTSSRHNKRKTLKTANAVYIGLVIHNGYIGFDLRKDF